jgi:hypothetical protein
MQIRLPALFEQLPDDDKAKAALDAFCEISLVLNRRGLRATEIINTMIRALSIQISSMKDKQTCSDEELASAIAAGLYNHLVKNRECLDNREKSK